MLFISYILCFRCFKNEIKIIETIRNIEFLNLVFHCTEDSSIVLKYSKTIFSRLESLMLNLTHVTDFGSKTYLPIGVITALVSSLFGKLMEFYREKIFQHVLQSNENLNVFISDTKVLRECLLKVWIKLSQECNNCVHVLVLERLTNSIKYLEFDEMDQKNLFSLCSELITSDCYPIEIGAYTILNRFVNESFFFF